MQEPDLFRAQIAPAGLEVIESAEVNWTEWRMKPE
jgi:hypothetical protein